MSSYNENLNASVVSSLQAQELKLSTTHAKLNAGMFTLYYTEDAKITAKEKLKRTEKKYSYQETLKNEGVSNTNITTNLISSANQEKEFNSKSVTNSSVAAANVQIAANAIVKLASDMGSIMSILNAADYSSQIFEQALAVNKLMNDTAYNAEVSSQLAMEASYLTAEVTSSIVNDMATATGASITDLVTILKSQLEATTTLQLTENNAFTDAATNQKKAEGLLIDANVEYHAATTTYLSNIQELNLNLQITKKSNSDFTVEFSPYKNPFYDVTENAQTSSPYNVNPVENYYIFVVKESEKTIFSIATAEGLIITPKIAHLIKPTDSLKISESISINAIKDINDDDLSLGENYVVFVLAQFTMVYKKALNNFEDYLTASSSSFALTNTIISPEATTIKVTSKVSAISTENDTPQKINVIIDSDKNNSNDKIKNSLSNRDDIDKKITQELTFSVNSASNNVEYRCMFIPDNSELVNGEFNAENLDTIEKQIVIEINNGINKIKNEEDKIKLFNNQNLIDSLTSEKNALIEQKKLLNQSNTAKVTDHQKMPKNNTNDYLDKQISDLKIRIEDLTSKPLTKLNPVLENQNGENTTPKPGFFFNKLIAENVTDGNYSLPATDKIVRDIKGKTTKVTLSILDNTTDNFGNPLIVGNKYIPVILSVSSGPKKIAIQFTNSISDFKSTETFQYATTNSKIEIN